MRSLLALTFLLIQSFSAPALTAARRAVSYRAASETVNQAASIPASPRNQPNTNNSLPLVGNFTPNIQFHIPDSPIDLDITFIGGPLRLGDVVNIVELALDAIYPNVDHHPTEPITNGFFRQRHDGLEIQVYQYAGRVITWYLLERLILGINYYTSQRSTPVELRFEIYVMGRGRVGYGSLWRNDLVDDGTDVAKKRRAVIAHTTSPRLSTARISKPALTVSNPSSIISPSLLNDSRIIFSYHLFGPAIPESVITLCFRRARESIRARLQRNPLDSIPDNAFEYSLFHIPLFISITAYPGKEISWRLLDRILQVVSAEIVGERLLQGCEFEFEIDPFLEPHGHGYLEYSP